MIPTRAASRLALALLVLVAAVAAPDVSSGAPVARAHAAVPFIDDDLPRALAEAKQRDLPIFVESWAPW